MSSLFEIVGACLLQEMEDDIDDQHANCGWVHDVLLHKMLQLGAIVLRCTVINCLEEQFEQVFIFVGPVFTKKAGKIQVNDVI